MRVDSLTSENGGGGGHAVSRSRPLPRYHAPVATPHRHRYDSYSHTTTSHRAPLAMYLRLLIKYSSITYITFCVINIRPIT